MNIHYYQLLFKWKDSHSYTLLNRRNALMIVYDRLWKTMKDKGISQYALIKKYKISPSQITRLKRNESVSTHTIDVFCNILQCDVSDIMEHIQSK